jgi:cytochrome c oxidase subunit II
MIATLLPMLLAAQAEAAPKESKLTIAGDAGSFWFPPEASNHAGGVDSLYFFIYWVSVVSFVIIVALMVFFIFRYRKTATRTRADKGSSHHNVLEIGWTIPPLLVSVVLFYVGTVGYTDMRTPPPDTYDIRVRAQKWAWEFEYPGGYKDTALHVPSKTPVRLVMSSQDVIHSLWIPAFRVKQDVVPGRYSEMWFEATQEGTFGLLCTEYCGTKHSDMLTEVVVQPQPEFENWLKNRIEETNDLPPEKAGELLVKARCVACHSSDGSAGIAPTMKGLWGKHRVFVSGATAQAEENYIRESILNPAAKVVQGYDPVMPTFQGQLKEDEIDNIIAYIKTLK